MKMNIKRFLPLIAIITVALGSPSLNAELNVNEMHAVNSSKAGLEKALERYFASNGAYPKTLDELGSPSLILDPWSKPFHYLMPGKHNPDKYDLWSGGPDGTLALANWDSPDNHAVTPDSTSNTHNYGGFSNQPKNNTGNLLTSAPTQNATSKGTKFAHLKRGEIIYHPSDKFPSNVSGIHVAGQFVTLLLQFDGLVLKPADGVNNPFSRLFTVTNFNTGLAPGQAVPMDPHLITIPRSQALQVTGRGLIPGTYDVTSPNPSFQ